MSRASGLWMLGPGRPGEPAAWARPSEGHGRGNLTGSLPASTRSSGATSRSPRPGKRGGGPSAVATLRARGGASGTSCPREPVDITPTRGEREAGCGLREARYFAGERRVFVMFRQLRSPSRPTRNVEATTAAEYLRSWTDQSTGQPLGGGAELATSRYACHPLPVLRKRMRYVSCSSTSLS